MIEANRLAVLEALSAGDSDEAVRVRVSPPAGESWSAAKARAIAAELVGECWLADRIRQRRTTASSVPMSARMAMVTTPPYSWSARII